MKKIILSNKGSSKIECAVATNFVERAVGLLGRSSLDPNSGLIIEPCKQVHTFFMRFPIDVVFLSKENEVLGVESLKPWRISKIYLKATRVVEIEHKSAETLGLLKGQRLEFT
jgi:uncharacterized membrane protein (UPF0127 family)